jgi:hypothetical protein
MQVKKKNPLIHLAFVGSSIMWVISTMWQSILELCNKAMYVGQQEKPLIYLALLGYSIMWVNSVWKVSTDSSMQAQETNELCNKSLFTLE